MPFVGELYFDPSTEERIREAWQALDEAGISDSMPKGGYRPHISFGICEHLSQRDWIGGDFPYGLPNAILV